MFWSVLLMVIAGAGVVALALPIVFTVLGVRFVTRRLLGKGDKDHDARPSFETRPNVALPSAPRKGCPHEEKATLRGMERRLAIARQQSFDAMDRRLGSEIARARISAPLEDAYAQIKNEIESIYAFCERNDLAGMLRKARQSSSAKDIYQEAYQRDLAKVRAAIEKTEECLTAYERTVATLEVSSVDSDISSDFDASIEMLRDLRKELPLYSLEDKI